QTIEREHGLTLILAAAENDDGIAALWPVLETRKGPFRVLGSPLRGWSTAYLGPLFAANVDVAAMISSFLTHPRLGKCAYFECRVRDPDHPVDLSNAGFHPSLR